MCQRVEGWEADLFFQKQIRPGPDGQDASRWYGRLRLQNLTLSVFDDARSLGQSFHHWHFDIIVKICDI